MHIFHKWSKWELIQNEKGEVIVIKVFEYENARLPYKRYVQEKRNCTVCNKLKIRKIYV